MKKMINVIWLIIFVFNVFFCRAQGQLSPDKNLNKKESKTLRVNIGDKVPDIFFEEILNYKQKSGKVSDFNGRLLILDFWTTSCAVCIKAFPKVENLQEKFGEKIMILSVGFDGDESGSIKQFVAKRKGTPREVKIPVAIQKNGEKDLQYLFPFSGVPHIVWINSDGVFIGTGGLNSLTEGNIRKVLNGEINSVGIKKLQTIGHPFYKSFLIRKDLKIPGPIYGSAFTSYIDSVTRNRQLDFTYDSTSLGIYFINSLPSELYQRAYRIHLGELVKGGNRNKRMIIEAKKKSIFRSWEDIGSLDNWEYEELFRTVSVGYQLVLPKSFSIAQASEWMIADLDRYFGVKSKIELRKVPCYLIVTIRTINPSKYRQRTQKLNPEGIIEFKGTDLNFVAEQLTAKLKNSSSIFLNNTNLDFPVDISIPEVMNKNGSLSTLKELLRKQGFDLIDAEKELKMLIISDN